jgi:integrase
MFFRQRYREEHLSGLAANSLKGWNVAAGKFEEIIRPYLLSDVTVSKLSVFVRTIRREGLAEASIACYLRTLNAGLSWAAEIGLIGEPIKARIPKRAKGRKAAVRGRPITGEEFERILMAIPKIRPHDSERWIHLYQGMWLSGLRLHEALSLTWDWSGNFSVSTSGSYPEFRIFAEGEKGHTDRILPAAPEFGEYLDLHVPEGNRSGLVFPMNLSVSTIQKRIQLIGDRSGVITNHDGRTVRAHDLRRSFGTRWASRITPAELRELMRHKSIETTMSYYVRLHADELAQKLRASVPGDILGDTIEKPTETQVVKELPKPL